MTPTVGAWRDIATKVQLYRDTSISRIQPSLPDVDEVPLNVTGIPGRILTDEEISITEQKPEDLIALLASGKRSSVDVVKAFLRRAGLAQKLVNCVTEVMPEQALERARYLDDYLAEHKKPFGPLHGLPVSVKEHNAIQGMTCNCGFVGWHDRVVRSNAYVVDLLVRAGAILYVRTTEPQLLMHLETSSNLYGVTVNPFNTLLTCGGSSGGEGALIGLRGSCLGLGSDIGGSIRSPAALNGIWGFRPTGLRLPLDGVEAPMKGYESITPTVGPLSTSFEGLNIFMKSLIDQNPWLVEPTLVPIPWNYPPPKSYFSKRDGVRRLRVAFLWHDGVVRPHPPVSRCLRQLADTLKSDPKITLCDWKPYKHDHAWDIVSSLYFPDGAAEDRELIAASGEPWRALSTWLIDEHPQVREYTVTELWQLNQKRDKYRTEHAALWNDTAADDEHGDMVDVIVAPVGPSVAPPLDQSKYWSYTSQWNLLDYPAMVFPYGTIDQKLDKLTDEDKAYNPVNKKDAECWKLWTDRGGAAGYQDAPISLQIIGRRFEDEKVFEAMQWIKQVAAL